MIPLRDMTRKLKGLPRLFDKPKHRQRNAIERLFGWLKENRPPGYTLLQSGGKFCCSGRAGLLAACFSYST